MRVHGNALRQTPEEDFIALEEVARNEGVKTTTAHRWLHAHGYIPYCRKRLVRGRMRLFVPLAAAEAYAAARGPYPVAARRPAGWVGVKAAAARLGCLPGSVHYRARRGELRAVRVARRVYFDISGPSMSNAALHSGRRIT